MLNDFYVYHCRSLAFEPAVSPLGDAAGHVMPSSATQRPRRHVLPQRAGLEPYPRRVARSETGHSRAVIGAVEQPVVEVDAVAQQRRNHVQVNDPDVVALQELAQVTD